MNILKKIFGVGSSPTPTPAAASTAKSSNSAKVAAVNPAASVGTKNANNKAAPDPKVQALLSQSASVQRDQELSQLIAQADQAQRLSIAQALEDEQALKSAQAYLENKDRRAYKVVKDKLAQRKQQGQLDAQIHALSEQYEQVAVSVPPDLSRLVAADRQLQALERSYGALAQAAVQALNPLREQINQRVRDHEAAQIAQRKDWVQLQQQIQSALASTDTHLPDDITLSAWQTQFDQLNKEAISSSLRKQIQEELESIKGRVANAQIARSAKARQDLHLMSEQARAHALEQMKLSQTQAKELERQTRAAAQAKQAQIKQELPAMIETLEQQLEQGQLQAAQHTQKKIDQLLDGQEPPHALSGVLGRARGQLRDLQSWNISASAGPRDELIEKAKALAAKPLVGQYQQEAIDELRKQWQQLTQGQPRTNQSQRQWEQFKTALDAAYEPVKQWRATMNKVRAVGAAARREQLQQLQSLLAQVDWSHVDWAAVEQLKREAYAAWRSAGPVGHKDQRVLGAEHAAIMQQIQTQLDQAKKLELKRRDALITEVNALAGQPNSLMQARQALTRWKDERLGVVLSRSEENESWQRMRAAQDAVFAQRQAQREQQTAQLQANADAKRTVLAQLQQAQQLTQVSEVRKELLRLKNEWNATGYAPRDQERSLHDQWRDGSAALEAHAHALTRAAQRALLDEALALEALCARAESQALDEAATQAVQDQWTQVIVAGLNRSALQVRLNNALQGKRADAAAVQAKATALLDLEIVTHTPSPAELQEQRLSRQVMLLAQRMSSRSALASANRSEVDQLLAWCAVPGVDASWNARVQAIVAQLTK